MCGGGWGSRARLDLTSREALAASSGDTLGESARQADPEVIIIPESDWEVVATALEASVSGPSEQQESLLSRLDLAIPDKLPQPVVAAILRRHLRMALLLGEPPPATSGELEYLESLAEETGTDVVGDADDRDAVEAWLRVMYAKRAAEHLRRLQPAPGDVIQLQGPGQGQIGQLSSISKDGRLNFRGGHGAGARPHRCAVIARSGDPDYDALAYRARQEAAARVKSPETVGSSQLAELNRWRVDATPGLVAVAALRQALTAAQDERPMQAVLEQHPELLAHLILGHHGTHVLSQRQLGAQYVPDFLVAGQTSLGVRWTLVEIESPTAALRLKDGQPTKQLRKALKQIADWREWLMLNADYARRSQSEDGLGLAGIRMDAQGLIIIGRGLVTDLPDQLRHRLSYEQRIEVRSYDWLARAASSLRSHPYGLFEREVSEVHGDDEF